MSAYHDAREALTQLAEQARHEVTGPAVEALDPSAYLYVSGALQEYAAAVHLATQEALALAVESVCEIEVVARWEGRLATAQDRLSDAVGAALVLGALGGS